MLYPKEIRNYRDWEAIDIDLWRHYWFGMVNRGVMAQPYWWDEQWTISVQHTEADIDKHLAAFDDIAASLAKAQQERAGTGRGCALDEVRRWLMWHRCSGARTRLQAGLNLTTGTWPPILSCLRRHNPPNSRT